MNQKLDEKKTTSNLLTVISPFSPSYLTELLSIGNGRSEGLREELIPEGINGKRVTEWREQIHCTPFFIR